MRRCVCMHICEVDSPKEITFSLFNDQEIYPSLQNVKLWFAPNISVKS